MAVLLASPTGSGKTVMAADMAKRHIAKGGKRVLFAVDRVELVQQTLRTMARHGVDRIDVRMAQSRKPIPEHSMLIVDECHIHRKKIAELIKDNKNKRVPVVGLSATPSDAKHLSDIYDELIVTATTRELIEEGKLNPCGYWQKEYPGLAEAFDEMGKSQGDFKLGDLSYTMRDESLMREVVGDWEKTANGQPTIVFTTDIAHCQAQLGAFQDRGHEAIEYHSKLTSEQRKDALSRFERAESPILVSVMSLTYGFDSPRASVGIICRATMLQSLHVQMCGRVLRLMNNKPESMIIDYGMHYRRFGISFEDYLPRFKPQREQAEKLDPPVKKCPACGFEAPASAKTCIQCGHVFSMKIKDLVESGELIRVDTINEAKCDIYGQLVHFARSRKMKDGWAWYKFRELFPGELIPRAAKNERYVRPPSKALKKLI